MGADQCGESFVVDEMRDWLFKISAGHGATALKVVHVAAHPPHSLIRVFRTDRREDIFMCGDHPAGGLI